MRYPVHPDPQDRLLGPTSELYRVLVETSSELIALLDAEGRIEFTNGAVREVIGYDPDEVAGRHFTELLDPDEAVAAGKAFREALGGRDQIRYETAARKKDGSEVELSVNAKAILDQSGGAQGLVVVISDVTETKLLREQLERLAREDDLTGLANRRRFVEEVERHLDHWARYGMVGAVLMVDVDGLKRVNDELGHAAGDMLIRAVANRLEGRLRRTDVLARLQGDEFAALLPHANAEAAREVGQALVRTLSDRPFDLGAEVRVTASAGIALIDERVDFGTLLARVDSALYEAKRRGGNGVVVHGES